MQATKVTLLIRASAWRVLGVRRGTTTRDWGSSQCLKPAALQCRCPQNGARLFHTTPRRQIPPVFWFLAKPIMKIGVALSGRGVRKWWQTLPKEQKSGVWQRIRRKWPVFAAGGMVAVLAGWGYYQAHLVEAPITGRRRFIVITHEQLMKISEAEAQVNLDRYQDNLIPVQAPLFQKVLQIATRLVESNPEIQQMDVKKWKLSIINDKSVNAFVVPNGHIFVFMGMINFVENEDQLAIILGHEMAHALMSHAAEQLSVAQLLDVFVIGIMAAIWTIMPNDGIAIVTQWFYNKVIHLMLTMPYSRKLEKEADKVGLKLATRACYDVREGGALWRLMGAVDNIDAVDVPEWLSTHPANEKRAEHLDFLVPEALELRATCQCPPLPKLDPRERNAPVHKEIDNYLTARKAGQNLRQATMIPSALGRKS